MTTASVDAMWSAAAYGQLSSIGALLDEAARRYADDTFIRPLEADLAPLSFRDLDAFVRGYEVLLERRGISPGDHCAVVSNNSTTLILQFLAIMATDRVFVPINPHSSSEDIAFITSDSGSRAIIYDSALEEKVSFLPESYEMVPFEEGRAFIETVCGLAAERLTRASRPAPGSVAEVVYTTGSTGRPKGVRLTHRNLLADLFGIGQVFGFARRERFLTVTPLFHNSGQITTTLIPLYCGGITTAIRPDMGFINFWHYVDRFEPEWTLVMPAHIALMLDRKESPRTASLRGILCGGAKLEPQVQLDFERRFGVPIYPNYGLTESASIATLARPGDAVRATGSAGRPLDINQVRIFVAEREAAVNETGEIRISGDNVFNGYVNLPDVYAEKVKHGWLHTGDLGYADEHGQIFIVDRIDNMVLIGGENVYPSEIERFVPELVGISQAFVLSIADRIMGRELVLVYRLQPGATADPKAWKSYLFEKLVRYKVPRRFIDVRELGLDDFPRAPNGKLLRQRLQVALEAKLTPAAKARGGAVRPEVFHKVAAVLAEVMDIDAASVTETLTMDQVGAWDSLNHLRLMLGLEEAFGVTLPPGEMAVMTSVQAILRAVGARSSGAAG
jgi:acyl-CoA synthetase (AMP-forming)/AMP-acid ligase II/acyl carrier protein